jgi:ketosteroid isomerase-like protein
MIPTPSRKSCVMDGKKEWGPWLDGVSGRTEFVLGWDAVRAVVGPSADMRYTTGDRRCTWKDADGNPQEFVGSYVAVWELRDDGTWKVIPETEGAGTSVWAARHSAPE